MLSVNILADNAKYVNMFLGSSGDHGQMTPGASVPFGMISVCPDSRPHQHGGYDYAIPEISGISINRISGAGCGGSGGNISIRPAGEKDAISIVKGTETAHPGYYATSFSNKVRAELTATVNMAVERYIFEEEGERMFFINFSSSFDDRNVNCFFDFVSDNEIEGWVESPTACAKGRYKLYIKLSADSRFTICHRDDETMLLAFPEGRKSVELRIAVSPVSRDAADAILKSNSDFSFEKIHAMAVSSWKEKLDKIHVRGSTEEQKRLFYTFLYRIYLSPMMVTSKDGKYKGTDGKIYSCKDFTYYSSWYIWDAFRSKFPLLSILDPETMKDICRSLADVYRTGKNDWATKHESAPSVRTEHAVIMLLDSYIRGAADKNCLSVAYPGMQAEAENLPVRTPDQKLESSYDLWALGRIAGILGMEEDAKSYSEESDSLFMSVWPSEFMTITEDFTRMRGNGLYQGSRWQYRWAAPHGIDKMAELAGMENLERELEEFFAKNYFNQGNEPDIHTPFLFNLLGNPLKTQEIVRSLLTDDNMIHLYGGNAEYPAPFIGRAFQNKVDGLAPEMDEDDGTMSAWYIFSSMGFYPVIAGEDSYEIFSPLYDRIVIRSGNARITIRTKGRKNSDDAIKGITVDGRPLCGFRLPGNCIRKNCRITIIY